VGKSKFVLCKSPTKSLHSDPYMDETTLRLVLVNLSMYHTSKSREYVYKNIDLNKQ
jgi:hypothetical protein